jgi:hypothetical protein
VAGVPVAVEGELWIGLVDGFAHYTRCSLLIAWSAGRRKVAREIDFRPMTGRYQNVDWFRCHAFNVLSFTQPIGNERVPALV